jgi:glycogen synthase
VSNLTRKTVIEKYGIPPDKVVTIYNAVEPPAVKITPERIKGKTCRTVTFLGRVTMQKGPEYFVEAASMVMRYLPDVRFVMAGTGDLMNMTIEHVARLGIADRFHFTGFLSEEEVNRLLAMSDILVMPSVSEPFGLVTLEAMMAGVPVIISKQSGVSEVVNHAFKIDFWDTFSLANAIYGLLKYPALWNLFSGKGITEAAMLDWNKTAEKVNLLYREVVKQHQAGDNNDSGYNKDNHPGNYSGSEPAANNTEPTTE